MRGKIESSLGFNLDWQEMPEKIECRICCKLDHDDPSDRSNWQAQHQWLAENLIALHTVFRPYIANLDGDNIGEETE